MSRRWSRRSISPSPGTLTPVEPDTDYTTEPPTLVEFTLEKTAGGTRLTVVESGFDKLPPERRLQAFRSNDGGWAEQVKNIERHLQDAA